MDRALLPMAYMTEYLSSLAFKDVAFLILMVAYVALFLRGGG